MACGFLSLGIVVVQVFGSISRALSGSQLLVPLVLFLKYKVVAIY